MFGFDPFDLIVVTQTGNPRAGLDGILKRPRLIDQTAFCRLLTAPDPALRDLVDFLIGFAAGLADQVDELLVYSFRASLEYPRDNRVQRHINS